jgi:hypothetical protein
MKTAIVVALVLGGTGCGLEYERGQLPAWAPPECITADHVQQATTAEGVEVLDCVWYCADHGDGPAHLSMQVVREPACRAGL